tara:strand:- start:164 stop:544 length:381 start_codon:yes stop_codon:yes gene_type:complete
MKLCITLALCMFCGCATTHKPVSIERNTNIETYKEVSIEPPLLVEINSVPPPFDVKGHIPYVLWINGMHISRPDQKALSAIVNKIGRENIPPINTKDIHKGWLEPRFVKKYFPNAEDIPWEQFRKQ